jgi:hypothetical protein
MIDLHRVIVDSTLVRAKKNGELTGPIPMDRGERGGKQHFLVDAGGIPLVVGLSAANVPDTIAFSVMSDNIPRWEGRTTHVKDEEGAC